MYDKNTSREVIDLETDHPDLEHYDQIPLQNFGDFFMNHIDPYKFAQSASSRTQSPNYSNMINLEDTSSVSKESIDRYMQIVERRRSEHPKLSSGPLSLPVKNTPKGISDLDLSSYRYVEEGKKESGLTRMAKNYSFTHKLKEKSGKETLQSDTVKQDSKQKVVSQYFTPTSFYKPPQVSNIKPMPLKETIPYPALVVSAPKPKRVLPDSMHKPPSFYSKKSEDENSALENLRQWKNRNLDANEEVQELPKKRSKPDDLPEPKPELPQKKLQTTQQLLNNIIQEQQKRTQEKIIDAKEEAQKREAAEKKYRESLWASAPSTTKVSEARSKEYMKKQRYLLRNDLSDFYRFILNLDLYNLEESATTLFPIPVIFDDGQDYINSFKPVFLEELRGDISSSARQMNFSKASLTSLRLYTKKDTGVYLSPDRDFDTSRPGFQFSFKPDDLVLLILYEEGGLPTSFSARPNLPYLLGICEFDIRNDKKVSPQLLIKISHNFEHLFSSENANFYYIIYVETLTTLTREYKMIAQAEFMELADFIMMPKTNPLAYNLQIPNEFWDTIAKIFNQSQIAAIIEICSKFRGVSLLQGPPGTGKTQTVMGILSAFLLAKGLTTQKPHVLVCAPSNAAVDELAYRVVKQGLIDAKGVRRNDLSCVRIGHWNQDHVELRQRNPNDRKEPPSEVKSISLGELVSNRIRGEGLVDKSVLIHEVKNELNKVDKALETAKRKNDTLLTQDLINKRQDLQNNLFRYKHEKLQSEDKKRHFQQEILNKADIVFCTLSGAGSREISQILHNFDFVIIDEACQSVELSSLIPLQYGAQIVVMVGDPQQLPSTTFSISAKRAGYDTSLFERLMKGGCPMFMLEIQYRMIPEIREFPSYYFYANRLIDAPCTMSRYRPTWLPNLPCMFFNYLASRESRTEDETSVSNYPEAALIVEIYEKLKPLHGNKLDIGVITPYRKQVRLIRNLLDEKFKKSHRKDIEVNTVDGFQGREKDLIIFSCVRAKGSVGFLADRRRMNVAITRARFAVWVIGKAETLGKNRDWEEYVKFMKRREWHSDVNGIGDVLKVFENARSRMDIDYRTEPRRIDMENHKLRSPVTNRNSGMQALRNAIEEDTKDGLSELVRPKPQIPKIQNSSRPSEPNAKETSKKVAEKEHSPPSRLSDGQPKPQSTFIKSSSEAPKKLTGKFAPKMQPKKAKPSNPNRFDVFEFIKNS
jgi:hypothetical protein